MMPSQDAPPSLSDRLASWLLGGPLTAAAVGLALVQLATWAPHYLTWPWFADHDVFAVLAQSWDAGLRPYRDLRCNNLPGTIYVFSALGKLFGWGRTVPFNAADAALVALLGVVMAGWSRRRLGRILPGAVGYLVFLDYYLGLDYALAGQHDWHAAFCAVAGTMAAEAWPGRPGRLAAAALAASALVLRPQAVLLMPATALAVAEGASGRRVVAATAEWAIATTACLALAFAPLALAGVLPDFVRGVSLVAPGGRYNTLTPAEFARRMALQLAPMRLWLVPVVLLALAGRSGGPSRRTLATWGVAGAGVLLYKPLSPVAHAYLAHPLLLVAAVLAALLVHLALDARGLAPAARLAIVLLVLAAGVSGRPRFCDPRASLRALADLRRGVDPEALPRGYVKDPGLFKSATYPWEDYRALLAYLRAHTAPGTRVANALAGFPAVAGPVGRLSAFPAESVAWLGVVRPEDADAFAAALAGAGDSVVVWAPDEVRTDGAVPLGAVAEQVRRHYEPEARFGAIEVWRRRADAPATARRDRGGRR